MIYIKLDEDKNLVTTVWEPIYRGEHLNQKIRYLVPLMVDEVDMLTATVFLNYIRSDGEPDIVILERQEDKYNESYYQYVLPVTCKLSKYPGEVVTWMQIYSGVPSDATIVKSGENIIQITESKDMDYYIGDYRGDKQLTALYQMKKELDDGLSEVNEAVEESNTAMDEGFAQVTEKLEALTVEKADNIVFDSEDSTIQLTANGEPIGDKITVSVYDGRLIKEMRITTDGELLVFFDDDSIQNLGKIVGDDGMVYVPHIDAHKILSFTIEDEAGEIPDPVDLNPSDEWSGIDGSDIETDYVWESIEDDLGNSASNASPEFQEGIGD